MLLCVCVCVCEWVREKERVFICVYRTETECWFAETTGKEQFFPPDLLHQMVLCNGQERMARESERERERAREREREGARERERERARARERERAHPPHLETILGDDDD